MQHYLHNSRLFHKKKNKVQVVKKTQNQLKTDEALKKICVFIRDKHRGKNGLVPNNIASMLVNIESYLDQERAEYDRKMQAGFLKEAEEAIAGALPEITAQIRRDVIEERDDWNAATHHITMLLAFKYSWSDVTLEDMYTFFENCGIEPKERKKYAMFKPNSKYDKPKCDCGNALYARRDETWSVARKIKKKWKIERLHHKYSNTV